MVASAGMGSIRIRVLGPARPSRWLSFDDPRSAIDFAERLFALVEVGVLAAPPAVVVEADDPQECTLVVEALAALERPEDDSRVAG